MCGFRRGFYETVFGKTMERGLLVALATIQELAGYSLFEHKVSKSRSVRGGVLNHDRVV